MTGCGARFAASRLPATDSRGSKVGFPVTSEVDFVRTSTVATIGDDLEGVCEDFRIN